MDSSSKPVQYPKHGFRLLLLSSGRNQICPAGDSDAPIKSYQRM
jgi:hypothetical protein